MSKPFYYQYEYRSAFLASMAGRLRDQICVEADEIFKSNNMATPVNDVSYMLYLKENGSTSIAELARAQDYSHQRVALRINLLKKLKLVTRIIDPKDQRRKLIKLTAKGQKEMAFLQKMYTETSMAIEHLFKEIDVDLMDKISDALDALKKRSLPDRLREIESGYLS
jgi:DNA-binding MarR family transcriptional regulator